MAERVSRQQHRWGGVGCSGPAAAGLQRTCARGTTRSAVRARLSRVQRYGTASATGSLAVRLDAPDDQAIWTLQRVRPLPGQTGVLVGIGGQPLPLEVSDHPQT